MIKSFIVVFSICQLAFAQQNSGSIVYKGQMPVAAPLDSVKTDPIVYDRVKNLIRTSSNLEFELLYNNEASKFKMVDKLNLEEEDSYQLSKALFGSAEYYYNFQNNVIIKKIQNQNIKLNNNLDWKLSNENKEINGYICYKATYLEKFKNKNGEDAQKTIIAWYCPEIPVRIGPEIFNNLPGLIMELNTGLFVYIINKINFTDEIVSIEVPYENLISQEEFLLKLKRN